MKVSPVLISAIAALVFIGGFVFITTASDDVKTSPQTAAISTPMNSSATSTPVILADTIEVVHFHATQQCWSCITVGEYALKTIKEKFPDEYASGKIVFKDIDGELKENYDLVVKYQARGSSLYVNAIRGGVDDILEDVTVWRLVSNEIQFIEYFENKLNSLLGR